MAALITNAGRAIEAKRMGGGTVNAQTEALYVQWGTSSTAESGGQTALQAPSPEARVAGTSSTITTTVANDTYQVQGTLTAAAGQTIREVGLFDGAGAGSPAVGANMFVRAVVGDMVLSAGDQVTYTVRVAYL